MATHTSPTQEQRWWSQTGKFSGLNGTFTGFITELRKEIEFNLGKKKENTRGWVVINRALKYVTIISHWTLSSKQQLDSCVPLQKMRKAIEHCPLPAAAPSVVVQVNGEDISSDVELNPTEQERPAGFPKGWLPTQQGREVSNYLKNIIESSVTGPALETIKHMGMSRDRNGFDTLERLAVTYGRDAAHVTNLPNNFVWGNGELSVGWASYKHMLESCEYIILHPKNEPLMVQCALNGFENYQGSYRILGNIRSTLGENPRWASFRDHCDSFLGDIYRQEF